MDGVVQRYGGLYGLEYRDADKRRKRREDRKGQYNAKALWQRSHEVCSLSARGFKNVEIAEILNITPETVSNVLNSELGQYKISELRKERDEDAQMTIEKIRNLTNQALNVYESIFSNENGQATLKDQKDVAEVVLLELSGLRVPTKVHSVSTTLTAQEIEEFKRRGIAAARESGLVVDVPPEVPALPQGTSGGGEGLNIGQSDGQEDCPKNGGSDGKIS